MSEQQRLLIVDDDQAFTGDLTLMLSGDFAVEAAHSSGEGLSRVAKESFDAVLLDIDLGEDIDGLDVLQKFHDLEPDLPVIMLSRTDDPSIVVRAGRMGAADFVSKGESIEGLNFRLRKALEGRTLKVREELRAWQEQLEHDAWIGGSAAAREIARQIQKFGPTNSPVLITGKTGSGKEIVARNLHAVSQRADGPFVAVNCASIQETLAESAFFGHEKGAFTGAVGRQRGCFELADGGTLFLDEFTEMRAELQPKLLRVIERGEVQRIGSEKVQRVDVRILAATNRELEEAIASGSLREDIYYRLAVLSIHVPPLKERRADISTLARLFAARKAKAEGKPPPQIEDETAAVLASYEWPGNVRELRNVIERAVILCDGDALLPSHLSGLREGFRQLSLPFDAARDAAAARFESDYVHAVLTLTSGNVTAAAERMGMSRQALYQIMQKHGIDAGSFRKQS